MPGSASVVSSSFQSLSTVGGNFGELKIDSRLEILYKGISVIAKDLGMQSDPTVVSHYSAFSFHGLTEQPPKNIFVTTLATVNTSSIVDIVTS